MKRSSLSALYFLLGSMLFTAFAHAATDVLIHKTTAENIDGHLTVLDDPRLNGQPERLLFLTQRFGTYNPHEVGVWYDKDRQRWTIYNEDAAKMPLNTAFHVLAVDPGSSYAFTHTATPTNSKEYYTMIAHPSLDHNPGAMILITPNFTTTYVPSPIGVWYTGTEWSIYRQDKKNLDANTRFNVLVVDGSNLRLMNEVFPNLNGAFVHQTTPAVTRGNLTYLDGLGPDDIVFATHNWGESGPYNNHVFGAWYNAQSWTLLNHDRGALATNTRFNVVVFSPSAEPAPSTKPTLPPATTTPVQTPPPAPVAAAVSIVPPAPPRPVLVQVDFVNRATYTAHIDLEYSLNGDTKSISSQPVPSGARARFQLPSDGTALLINIAADSGEGSARKIVFENTYPTVISRTINLGGTIDSPSWIER